MRVVFYVANGNCNSVCMESATGVACPMLYHLCHLSKFGISISVDLPQSRAPSLTARHIHFYTMKQLISYAKSDDSNQIRRREYFFFALTHQYRTSANTPAAMSTARPMMAKKTLYVWLPSTFLGTSPELIENTPTTNCMLTAHIDMTVNNKTALSVPPLARECETRSWDR